MASGGRELSSRMSAEAQNIDGSIERMALRFFKMLKIAISQAIGESYPLLQLLHYHDFITSETYDVSKESFKKGHNVEGVVYNILIEVEKKFGCLLKVLFNKFTMKKTPDLDHIYEIFKNESEAEENKEMHDIQSSLEQMTISDDSAKCGDADEPPKASTPAVKRKTGTGQQPDVPVNFQAEILPVTCKEETGLLVKRRMERGTTAKCIAKEEICWFTLSEFVIRGGYKTSRDWRNRLRCGGRTLGDLMKDRILHSPPRKHRRNKQGADPGKCKICQDEGTLLCCGKCQSFFHGDCHLPPVDTQRKGWNCTFCTIENSSQSQQRYRESEVLKKVMGPEEKLKCEFLLLKVYGHLEGNIFPNIPCENYVEEASHRLEKLRKLDIIKKSLNERHFPYVESFMQAMDNFFTILKVEEASHCLEKLRKLDIVKKSLTEGHFLYMESFMQAIDNFFTILKCNDAELTQDDFKKNFKDIFVIQETN